MKIPKYKIGDVVLLNKHGWSSRKHEGSLDNWNDWFDDNVEYYQGKIINAYLAKQKNENWEYLCEMSDNSGNKATETRKESRIKTKLN